MCLDSKGYAVLQELDWTNFSSILSHPVMLRWAADRDARLLVCSVVDLLTNAGERVVSSAESEVRVPRQQGLWSPNGVQTGQTF